MEPLQFCEHYVFRKQHQTKFPKVMHITKTMLDYVHFDHWGPSRVQSLGGARYFLSITDDYSRMTWVFMKKKKSKAFNFFKPLKILMKNETRKTIKYLRIDNGLESCST